MLEEHSEATLKLCGSLQKFGSFAMESKHQISDKIFSDETNHKAHIAKGIILQHLVRDELPFEIVCKTKHQSWHTK
jgi:hypothetical protein